jgi:hypothetical protein
MVHTAVLPARVPFPDAPTRAQRDTDLDLAGFTNPGDMNKKQLNSISVLKGYDKCPLLCVTMQHHIILAIFSMLLTICGKQALGHTKTVNERVIQERTCPHGDYLDEIFNPKEFRSYF